MLKAILNDTPPDELSQFYTETENGSFVLQVEPVNGFSLEDVQGLKKTLSDRTERHKKAQAKLTGFGDFTPEQIEEIVKENEKLRDEGSESHKEKINAAVRQMNDKHGNELKQRDEREHFLLDNIRQFALDARADAAIAEIAIDQNAAKLLKPHVLANLGLKEEDGKFETFVVDPSGNPRLSMAQGSSELMSVEEYVDSMRKDDTYSLAFKGTGQSGSGATNSQGGSSGRTVPFTLSSEDARNPHLYRQAKEAASAAGAELTIT